MNVLVTGGAGYIGSHICKLLYQNGHTPVVYDNLSSGHKFSVKWGPFVFGELADYDKLVYTMSNFDIKGVIHLAAYAYIGESMNSPRMYFNNNVANSLNLLNAMQDSGVTNIVFSSTCATYGIPKTLPILETASQNPVNPYGESKLFVEKILKWYESAYNLKWVILRYFNAAGADPDGEIGEAHDPETHLIPLLIQTSLGKRGNIELFGSDYDTVDGSAIRDYIHVNDLAWAHVLSIQHLEGNGESIAVNLGTGQGHSVRQVISIVEEISGSKIAVQILKRREGDPPILIADPSSAWEKLGWEPKYRDLNSIIATAWNWHIKSQRCHED